MSFLRTERLASAMSRKAAERRNGEGFVEAHLWACTKGRPYKPRFAAERSVVLVSGGGAGERGADTPVAAAANGIAARRAASLSSSHASSSTSHHPLQALVDAIPTADALFRDTGCETVFVVDYSPLAKDLPSELASTFPGKVAKPVGRVIQKLNPANSVFAAAGADAAVLFKAMKLTGDEGVACVVIVDANDIPSAGLPKDAVTVKPAIIAGGETHGTALGAALPNATRLDAAAGHSLTECLAMGYRAEVLGDADVSWMGDDARVFYSRVTFEHDKYSKQISQKVTGLRAEELRALAEKKGEEEGEKEVEVTASREAPTPVTEVNGDTEDARGPIIYVATRPFHPARLASTLREHFGSVTAAEVTSTEVNGGGPRGGEVEEAAEAASRAADAACALAARVERAFIGSADPAVVAVVVSLTASSAAAAASATAAVAAAKLLSSASEPDNAATTSSVTPPSGPFRGVTRSAGIVWIASRPTACGRWTTCGGRAGAINVACLGDWTTGPIGRRHLDADADTWLGETRQELVFEGDDAMDHARLRAALDTCLLTEREMDAEWSRLKSEAGEAKDDDSVFCFSPWPDRTAHLASLGVHVGGRGSRAIAMATAKKGMWGGFWETNEEGAADGVTRGMANVGVDDGDGVIKTVQKTGAAALGFGGKVGVRDPEAFVAPPKDVDVRQFPSGKGHFWPKMPCLECGSPWWLGDDWDASCANCGGDAESYDNNQTPHKEYRRRFERFRRLIDDLLANRG